MHNSLFYSLALAVAGALTPFATATAQDGPPLKSLAGDMLIGAVGRDADFNPGGTPTESQQRYREIFARDLNCGQVLSYPSVLWNGEGQYDFSTLNSAVDYFEEMGYPQLAHTLTGPRQYYPQWFKDKADGGAYTPAQLEGFMEDFIREVMNSNDNGEKIETWNVVNEPFWYKNGRDGEVGYVGTFWNRLGSEPDQSGLTGTDKVLDSHPLWIRKAFAYAAKYTDNKLEVRENQCIVPGQRSYKYFYQLVRHLINSGVKVDVVGIQARFRTEQQGAVDWSEMTKTIQRYKALGVEVYLTETEIPATGGATVAEFEKQGNMYYEYVKAARLGGVDMLNFWGIRDGQLGGNRSETASLLYTREADPQPKPSYYAVQRALRETQDASTPPTEPEPPTEPGPSNVLTFESVADAFVNSAAASTNYGSAANVAVHASPSRELTTLLRFDVSGLAGRAVTSAKLVLAESDAGTTFANNSAAAVYPVTGTWSEGEVTWATRPPVAGGRALGTLAANSVTDGQVVEIPIAADAIAADGSVSLAIVATSNGNDVHFSSREGAAAARLVVTAGGGGGGGGPTPPPTGDVVVRARGLTGGEVIDVTVAGASVGTATLTTAFAEYAFPSPDPGALRVAFANDAGVGHDVEVDYVTFGAARAEAEGQAVNTGVWNAAAEACGGVPSQMLHCTGYIEFAGLSARSRASDPAAAWRVYPNPASHGDVTLAFDPERSPYGAVVSDVTGRVVRSVAVPEAAAARGEVDLDIAGLPGGLYAVTLLGDGFAAAKRLEVVR